MKKLIIAYLFIAAAALTSSCKKYLDINKDPDSLLDSQAPVAGLLTNITTNIGFTGGSDLYRYAALLSQQLSGQTTGGETQTQAFEKYLIQSADVNNLFNSLYAQTLSDIEVVIKNATAEGSPHYAGVAKVLKAFAYQLTVDAWGDVPYSETQQMVGNLAPKYDDDQQIYTEILKMIDAGITDINAATSFSSPGNNSTIYSGAWSTKKANWIKFANTLKLRVLLHYSKFDKAFATNQITTLVNSGATFMAANADNFETPFFNAANRQNSIHQFELNRQNYLFPNKFLVDMMNTKADPRRPVYFTQFPAGSGNYAGAKAADAASQKYSRIHTWLRGAVVSSKAANADGSYEYTAITYTGDAPIRMLTFAEYNFIRAEAALMGAPGDAQAFFTAGITASMKNAGVADADIATYLLANGTLTGSDDNKLKQIIEEKYVANFGVVEEPWTDWRRTGYPAITKVSNAVTADIPRSLPYPQLEMDINPNAPDQKPNLLVRVFWDKP
jgi:hypothetical protein